MTKRSNVKPKPRLYSQAQLAQDFGLSRQTIAKRLSECVPGGKVRGYDAFTLIDAAPFILDPDGMGPNKEELDTKELDPDDMPPDMQKDYWDAKLKKQKHDKEAGHLWDTVEVVEVLSETFKQLSQKLRTLPDVLERGAGLDADQVDRATQVIFEAQEAIYEALVQNMGGADV